MLAIVCRVLEEETWANTDLRFDTVLCMNLLDRCDRPLDILADITRVLNPNGTLVLALVLPFKPYVEMGMYDPPSLGVLLCELRPDIDTQLCSIVHVKQTT